MLPLPRETFRISRGEHAKSAHDALSGAGGLYGEGRWHSKGKPIIYTASSRALCLLERIVYADEWLADTSHDRVFLDIQIPDVSYTYYTSEELEDFDYSWRRAGSPLCRTLGDLWLRDLRSYALLVPSAVVAEEYNLLLNPLHPEHAAVVALNNSLTPYPVRQDDRLGTVIAFRAKPAA